MNFSYHRFKDVAFFTMIPFVSYSNKNTINNDPEYFVAESALEGHHPNVCTKHIVSFVDNFIQFPTVKHQPGVHNTPPQKM